MGTVYPWALVSWGPGPALTAAGPGGQPAVALRAGPFLIALWTLVPFRPLWVSSPCGLSVSTLFAEQASKSICVLFGLQGLSGFVSRFPCLMNILQVNTVLLEQQTGLPGPSEC